MQRHLESAKAPARSVPPQTLCSSEPFNFLSGLLRNPSDAAPECVHSGGGKKKSPSLCKLASVSPGRGDTGISGDEPRMEKAVIEVFKKVRGDYSSRNERHCLHPRRPGGEAMGGDGEQGLVGGGRQGDRDGAWRKGTVNEAFLGS